MWIISVGLLLAWCVFTGVSATSVDFSGTNSHWMWLAGLLLASAGGLGGVAATFIAA
jgi:hypothetical protein